MPTLVKIGFDYFLVKNEAAAVAVVKAMAGTVQLSRNYEAKGRDEFYPDPRPCEIGIVNVLRDQILRCQPSTVESEAPDRAPLQLKAPNQ